MNSISECLEQMDPATRRQVYTSFSIMFILLAFPFISVQTLLVLSLAGLIVSRILTRRTNGTYPPELYTRPNSVDNLFLSIVILFLISNILAMFSHSLPLYVIGQAVGISTFGVGVATIIRCRSMFKFTSLIDEEYPAKRYRDEVIRLCSLNSSIALLIAGIIYASLAGLWICYWQGMDASYDMIFFVAVIGSITGALFESIPSNIDENISVTLGSGMAMWAFSSFGYSVPPQQMVLALLFALFLGYVAYWTRIADISAVLSATIMGVLVIVFSNILWFVLLLTFFILGGMFTKYRYRYKEALGLAQSKGGVRTYENVFSNSTAALTLAIAHGIFPEYSTVITYAFLGTVATAIGDTLASEIGITSKQQPRLITTLQPVQTGIDGGVTLLGELAAIGGSVVIGILAFSFGVVDNAILAVVITVAGGFLGTNFDSVLGATLQNRKMLSNSGVNFVATFAGAMISGGLYMLFN